MDPLHVCSVCRFTTGNYEELKKHLEVHFGDSNQVDTNLANQTFDSVLDIPIKSTDRSSRVGSQILLECSYCSYKTYSNANFGIHMKTHAYQKTYKCEKCNRHFGQLSSYTRHRRRYKQKSHICGICTMQFHLKQELAEHLISHYNQQEEFDCLVKSCNKKFFALIYLKTHLRGDHKISSENKMPCKSCDRELPSVRSFLIHIQLKHQMPNENESGDTSDTSGVVSGSPEFQLLTSRAPIQDGSTGSSLIHTPHSTATPAPTSSIQTSQVAGVNDVQNPFLICPYCDSVFSNIVNFLIHVFLHTLGEPLKCIICQVSFVNKADFSIHSMVSHNM